MAILNPQYLFLEADYENPTLNQVEHTPEDPIEKIGNIGDIPSTLRLTSMKIFAGANWMLTFLVSLPVDIYCVIALLILKNF